MDSSGVFLGAAVVALVGTISWLRYAGDAAEPRLTRALVLKASRRANVSALIALSALGVATAGALMSPTSKR